MADFDPCPQIRHHSTDLQKITGVITLATHVAMPNSVRICLQGVSELIDEIKEKKIKKYSMHWLRMNLLSRSLSD